MQPITYSLIINVLALLIAGGLAWAFSQPWIFVIALLLQTHVLQRFEEKIFGDDEDNDAEGGGIGFTADIK